MPPWTTPNPTYATASSTVTYSGWTTDITGTTAGYDWMAHNYRMPCDCRWEQLEIGGAWHDVRITECPYCLRARERRELNECLNSLRGL